MFLILWRHKKKWFINNSKKLFRHSREKNQTIYGIYLIIKLILTELIFLKEKNESAEEYGYMIPGYEIKIDPVKKHYRGDYRFKFMDAFTSNINMWSKFFRIEKLNNKELNYLEIGAFEGRSGVYILENLNKAKCYFVDPFENYDEMTDSTGMKEFDKLYNNFLHNVNRFGERVKVFRETSDMFFEKNNEEFDLIYVDGSHFGEDVYRDSINSFECLKSKGYIIFDDFFWFFFETINENPLGGIFKFLVENKKNIKVRYLSNQLIIQKNKNFSFFYI